jgi:uncharacterized damage-inducible protein DinB
MADAIADLFKHNLWANLRLLDACASLSADDLASTCEGTYGPLGDTLTHMLASEERYVMQWTPAERRSEKTCRSRASRRSGPARRQAGRL